MRPVRRIGLYNRTWCPMRRRCIVERRCFWECALQCQWPCTKESTWSRRKSCSPSWDCKNLASNSRRAFRWMIPFTTPKKFSTGQQQWWTAAASSPVWCLWQACWMWTWPWMVFAEQWPSGRGTSGYLKTITVCPRPGASHSTECFGVNYLYLNFTRSWTRKYYSVQTYRRKSTLFHFF